MISLQAQQSQLADQFAAAGIDSARLDARLLMQHALDADDGMLLREAARELSVAEEASIQRLAVRRIQREPMSQILGTRDFWRDAFIVSADVLTPRPDSETLIEAMLEHRPERSKPYQILDLGVGSGCLLLSLLREYPAAQGRGIDISEAALAIAAQNAETLGLSARTTFSRGDWMQTLQTRYDMIITNPPYIEEAQMALLEPDVKDYEPHVALSGGDDGLNAYRVILNQATSHLTVEGIMVMELGAGQAKPVAALAEKNGFTVQAVRKDLGGIERALVLTN